MQGILIASRAALGTCSGRLSTLASEGLDREVSRLCFVCASGLLTKREFSQAAVCREGEVSGESEYFVPKFDHRENLEANMRILEQWGLPEETRNRVKNKSRALSTVRGESLGPKLDLLEKEVGMGKAEVAKVVEKFHSYLDRPSTKTVEPLLEIFRAGGIPVARVRSLILRKPVILGFHTKLNELSCFFQQEFNFSQKEFLDLVVKFPQLSGYHIDQNMRKKISYFLDLGISREDLGRMVLKYPQLFGLSIENNVNYKMDRLTAEGIPKEKLVESLKKEPQLLGRKFLTILDKIKSVQKDLGVSSEEAFALLNRNFSSFQTPGARWKEVQSTLESCGFSPPEATKILLKDSKVLRVSCQGLSEKIKFAKVFLGKSNKDLTGYTRYLTASFQDKIFFRSVFLDSQGEDIRKVKLPSLIKSDSNFFERFDKTLVDNFRIKWGKMSQPERLTAIVAKSVESLEQEEKGEEKGEEEKSEE